MAWWGSFLAAFPFAVILIASGFWANSRFARFDRLPSHFNIRGEADAFAPRRLMAWALPILFSLILLAIPVLVIVLPPEAQHGDPLPGVVLGGTSLVGAEIFVLWLTVRWARKQG